MAKQLVTCTARGPRVVNAFVNGKDDKEGVEQVTLNPGEARELALVNPDHKAFQGMIDERQITLGEVEEVSEEEEQTRQEALFRDNPIDKFNRESAEAAARTPGLADPLPQPPRERPKTAAKAPAKKDD